MGLLYLFPVSPDEKDHVLIAPEDQGQEESPAITLRSYGLPLLFWGYLAAILVVISLMFLLIRSPLQALMETGDPLNLALGRLVSFTLAVAPVCLIAFFFYEKNITKKGNRLKLTHRLFFLPFRTKTMALDPQTPFFIRHFMDSPNLVRKEARADMQQYMNKGYFELWGKTAQGEDFLIDRNSQKRDLVRLEELLLKY